MLVRMSRFVLSLVFLGIGQFALGQAQEQYITEHIEYKTEDGWTISGTLRLPLGSSKDNEYPGMVLLHEMEHDRNDFVGVLENPGLAERLAESGIASLVIDWRGRGKSAGEQQPVPDDRHFFSVQTQRQMYMDVKGAMEFMADYPGVDRLRIGVLGSAFSAEHMVRGIQETAVPTQALVFLGGSNLSQESKDFLASTDIPIFAGASIVDKPVLLDMTEVYVHSKNPSSYLATPYAGERGYNILLFEFLQNLDKPGETRLDFLVSWLHTELKKLGNVLPVTLTTEDGWDIHANYRYPDDMGKDGKLVPAVVMATGARADRYSMIAWELELARRGFAVISIDMRGRGQSTQGKQSDAPEIREMWDKPRTLPLYLDVVAAIEFVISQKGIDPNRLAIMGEAIGSRNALIASEKYLDRIKTMVFLSVNNDEDTRRVMSKVEVPVLFIDAELDHSYTRSQELHKIAKNSQFIAYQFGHAHHIRYFSPEVVEVVGKWMQDHLP